MAVNLSIINFKILKCNENIFYRCDADPAALSRYVLALLKKDKAIKELQQCMTEQLDVFLGHETAPFLSRLFQVIESEEYIPKQLETEPQPESTIINQIIEAVTKIDKECTPPLAVDV